MGTGLKATLCYGGHRRELEDRSLSEAPALIIGTPGRLTDHLRRGNIPPEKVRYLVLDEFDKSLELGFQEEMAEAVGALTALRQRILCSATESLEIPAFVGMSSPLRLSFSREAGSKKLQLQLVQAPDKDKAEALFRLLCLLGRKQSVVFLNHRQAVERVDALLVGNGISAVAYHGGMEQEARELALARFRNGSARTLLATDLAARGLDISEIESIIHYHLPPDEASFTHRNGRTARMDAKGTAIVLLGPEERLPSFLQNKNFARLELPDQPALPPPPDWLTLYISAGKKDKLSKADILGFLTQAAGLEKKDAGLMEVKDFSAFVAVRAGKEQQVLRAAKSAKLKGQKRMIRIAR